MQGVPTPDEVRALVAPLDERDRKVAGGLVALLIGEPARIRDREWLAERFVQLAVVAHGFDGTQTDDSGVTSEDVERIRDYAAARMPALVAVARALFVRTAAELQGRGAFGFEDAQTIVQGYLAS